MKYISNEEVFEQLGNIYKSGRRKVDTVIIKKGSNRHSDHICGQGEQDYFLI